MAKLPDNVRHYLNATPGSVASIVAAVYSVPGVRHAFVISGVGRATVVIDSDEDLEPVMELLDQVRPAGVQIDIVRPEDLGTLIDQRVADALVRQALVFKKAEVAASKEHLRSLTMNGIRLIIGSSSIGAFIGLTGGWLIGAHG